MTTLSGWLLKITSFGAKRSRWRLVPASWLTVCLLWLTLAPLAPGFGTAQAAAATLPLPAQTASSSLTQGQSFGGNETMSTIGAGSQATLSKGQAQLPQVLTTAPGQNQPQNRAGLATSTSATRTTAQTNVTGRKLSDPQARAKWFYGQRALPALQTPAGSANRALAQGKALPQFQPALASQPNGTGNHPAATGTTVWTPLGPNHSTISDPINIGPYANVSGRLTALAYVPPAGSGTGTIYAGAAGGGLWKSSDDGASWQPLLDNQPSLAVGALAVDPINTNVIYVGTGEANANLDGYYSVGLLKSSNGGQTWQTLGQNVFAVNRGNNTTTGTHISKIVLEPGNTQNLWVASDNGLWFSPNGGTDWTNKPLDATPAGASATLSDLLVLDSQTIVAAWANPQGAGGNGVYKSTNGGASFTRATDLPSGQNVRRIGLAQAASQPSWLYLLAADSNGSSLGVWQSTTSGTAWSQVTTAQASGGPDLLGDDVGGQTQHGLYSLVIGVDPTNAELVYAGGLNLFQSANHGTDWTDITNVFVTTDPTPHPDQHALTFVNTGSNPSRLLAGNDGGIYSYTATGAGQWVSQNSNLAITEFYSGSTTGAGTSWLGGSQGTGLQKYGGTPDLVWSVTTAGDGGQVIFDPRDPTIAYGEGANLTLFKSNDGGSTWATIGTGINQADNRLYLAPFALDPANSQHLLAGTTQLYESNDGGQTWQVLSSPGLPADPGQPFGAISALGFAPTTGQSTTTTFYVGTGDGKVWVDKGGTWQDITSGTIGASSQRFVTSFGVNPLNPDDVVVTFSGFANSTSTGTATGTHIYRSTNGGAAWSDISTGLPDSPVNSVLRHPSQPNTLYIGSDAGFFFTTSGDQATGWQQYQNGLPNVVIDQLFADASFTNLMVASHGRGMFKLATATLVPAVLSASPTSLSFAAQASGSNPASQPVSLSASGSNITWGSSITYGSGATNWLSINPATGTVNVGTNSTVSVSVNTAGLAAGNYSATITFQDNDPNNPGDKAVVTVTLVVSAAPQLTSSPGSLSFSAVAGRTNPVSQTVNLNAINAPINWSAAGSNISYGPGATGWLSLSPSSGTVTPGTAVPVTVSASLGTLAAGTYSATITFQDQNPNNSSDKAVVSVSFVVQPAPTLTATPTQLNFAASVGQANPAAQNITLQALNAGTNWGATISYGPGASNWLSLNPSAGALAANATTTISVSATTGTLTAGTYTATMSLQETGYSADQAVVNVTFVVSPAPVLSVTPTSLSFTGTAGGANPAAQNVSLSVANGTVNWTSVNNIVYGPGATGWLSLNPTNGSVSPGSPVAVGVSPNTAGLAAGSYTATINFVDTTNSQDKASVTVSLQINPTPARLSLDTTSLTFDSPMSNVVNRVVNLSAVGGTNTIRWTAAGNISYGPGGSGWLSLDVSEGMIGQGQPVPITIVLNTNKLTSLTTYTATITFVDKDDATDKVTVSVTLNLTSNWTFYGDTGQALSLSLQGNSTLWVGTYSGVVKVASSSGAVSAFYTPADGLTGGVTHASAIDLQGIKWFATGRAGVTKFDDPVWTNYNTGNSGIVSNDIRAIAVDAAGNKWFGGYGGLSKFDGTNWTNYTTANSGLVSNNIYSLTIDKTGKVWIGTGDSGLSVFDGTTWTTYNTANTLSLHNNLIYALTTDTNGNVWIGTLNGGLTKHSSGGAWANFSVADPNQNTILAVSVNSSTGDVWCGTGGGVRKLHGATWTTYDTTNSPLTSNNVNTVLVDGAGNTWAGVGSKGLFKFNGSYWTNYSISNGVSLNQDGFFPVNQMLIDNSGNKWFATGSGVAKFDGTTWTNYNTTNSGLPSNIIYSMAFVKSTNNLWFGTNGGGASRFDGTTWTTYNKSNSGLADDFVKYIAVDNANNKWFATNYGVSKFNNGVWTTYTTANGLVSNIVEKIAVDSSGNVWFATAGGLSKFDGTNWTSYTTANSGLVNNIVKAIALDSKGSLWIGTVGGVNVFDGTNWTTYTTANSGLVDNFISTITFDSAGNIWLGSKLSGVSKLRITTFPRIAFLWTTYTDLNSSLGIQQLNQIFSDTANNRLWFMGDLSGLSVYYYK